MLFLQYRYFYAKNEVLVVEKKKLLEKSPKKKEYLSKKELKDLMKPSTPILHRKRGGAWGN